MLKAAIYTLGCKVNTCESDEIVKELLQQGVDVVPFTEKADLYIVNTCSVTQMADKKSRQILHRARRNSPGALIAATGCFAQKCISEKKMVHTDHCTALDSEIAALADLWIPNSEKDKLVSLVMAEMRSRNKIVDDNSISNHSGRILSKAENYTSQVESPSREFHTRAFLKVQDGCRQFCTYCIIPYMRGILSSEAPEKIEEQARNAAQAGFREIVLTGIHLSSYGRKGTFHHPENPEREMGLSDLIDRLSQMEGIERIRLGSLEPGIVTPQFIGRMRLNTKLCPHFHLSLQSGCAKTLKSMNRHYTPEQYEAAVKLLREAWPEVAVTTDVIVGFPGETEEDFEESLAFVKKIRFAHIHVFKYSRREGTAADRRPDQIPETIKSERSEKVIEASGVSGLDFVKKYVGQTMTVLMEEKTPKGWTGYTKNYMRVYMEEKKEMSFVQPGKIVPVLLKEAVREQNEEYLKGEWKNV